MSGKLSCRQCKHCKDEGNICGYSAISCELHGDIESAFNPHHKTAGERCEDFDIYSWMKQEENND